jgi:hypothetical protein
MLQHNKSLTGPHVMLKHNLRVLRILLPLILISVATGRFSARAGESPVSPAVALAGQGGLAGLSPQDVATLRTARDRLKDMILDPGQAPQIRRQEMLALMRVHEALADWGTEGQAEWYLQALVNLGNENLGQALVELAESSAKGPVYHVAGIRAFWQRIEALTGGNPPQHLRPPQNRFARITKQWEKPPALNSGVAVSRAQVARLDLPRMFAPLKVTPQRIDLSKVLKPYPEEPPPR